MVEPNLEFNHPVTQLPKYLITQLPDDQNTDSEALLNAAPAPKQAQV